MRMNDDLPAPFGPSTAVCWPCSTISDRFSKTRVRPRTSVAFFNSSTGSIELVYLSGKLEEVEKWKSGKVEKVEKVEVFCLRPCAPPPNMCVQTPDISRAKQR